MHSDEEVAPLDVGVRRGHQVVVVELTHPPEHSDGVVRQSWCVA